MNEEFISPGPVKQALSSYRRFRIVSNAVDVFAIDIFNGLLILLALKILSFFILIENLFILQAVALLFAIVKAGYATLRKSYSLLDSAIDADVQFELKEKLSTAVEFADKPLDSEIYARLTKSAADSSKNIVASAGFKPKANKFAAMGIAALLAITALSFVPNKMDDILANKRELKILNETTEKRVEKFKKEITGSKISNTDKEALLKELERLLKDLKLASSKEDALAKLNKHQDDLAKRLPAALKRSDLAVSQLANTLAQEKELSELAKAIQSRDPAQVNKSLSALNKALSQDKLTQDQKRNMAEALKKAAALMAPLGQTGLANGLNSAGNAINSSSNSQLKQSLADLNNILAGQINNANMEQAVSSMLTQLDENKAAIQAQSQAGQGSANQPGSSSNPGSANNNGSSGNGAGKGAGSGQGQGAGQGSGSGKGQGAGKGAGAGQGGIGAQGGGAGKSGMQPGIGIVDADRAKQIGEHQSIQGSTFLNSNGEKVQLSGLHGFGEEIQMGKSGTSRSGSSGSALSPYSNLYANYFNFTAQAINRGEIPKSYEKLVLDYFSQINPNN